MPYPLPTDDDVWLLHPVLLAIAALGCVFLASLDELPVDVCSGVDAQPRGCDVTPVAVPLRPED